MQKLFCLMTFVLFSLSFSTQANLKKISKIDYPAVQGEFIVKIKKINKNAILKLSRQYSIKFDRSIAADKGLYVVKFDQSINEKSLRIGLLNDASFEYVEPNYIYTIGNPQSHQLGPVVYQERNEIFDLPNDPRFGKLWGLNNTGNNIPGGLTGISGADISALKAWEITKGDRAIRVAVIDTGIDYRHEDLAGNMWTNSLEIPGNNIDDDNNGYVDDIHGYDFANGDGDPLDGHGHGTHCAGTIGAIHNNATGVSGVMGNVTLVGVKFLSDSGSGTTENAIKAIEYARKVQVNIMSNSWGGGGYSRALEEAIQRAADDGILFIAAAGNSSSNNDRRPHYPSNYDVGNIISVAATTGSDTLASFSSYGRNSVHISAPGHKILSTVKNNSYKVYSGTSMATPHVAGALGLLLSQETGLNVSDIKGRLIATSDPVAALRGKNLNGGRLNAYNLLTNTVPERNEPVDGEWVEVAIDNVWESQHPYKNKSNIVRNFNVEGAKFIRLKVEKYEIENKYDFLEVADGEGSIVEKVYGSGEDYSSDYIIGDTMRVTFVSDHSVSKWGFVISSIEVQY